MVWNDTKHDRLVWYGKYPMVRSRPDIHPARAHAINTHASVLNDRVQLRRHEREFRNPEALFHHLAPRHTI
jgi:hypothetical protein